MNAHNLLEPLTRLHIHLPDRPEVPYTSTIEEITGTKLLIDNPFGGIKEGAVQRGQKIVCSIEHREALYG